MIIPRPKVDIFVRLPEEFDPARTPLFCLHGFTGSHRVWDHLRSRCPHSTVAIDLPGHGESRFKSPAEYSFGDWCEDFRSVLTELKLEKIHLLGYSMGGRLALLFALTHPRFISSLTLESATPGISSAEERRQRVKWEADTAQRMKEDFTGFLEDWRQLPFFRHQLSRNPEEFQRLQKIRQASNPEDLIPAFTSLGTGRQPDLWPKLGEATFPVLLLAGEEDTKFVDIARRMAEGFPQSELRIILQSGHTLHLEQAEAFSREVVRFLDDAV